MTHRYDIESLAVTLAAVLALGGCSSQAPCLQYSQQTHTRVISLRGHGTVQVREAALVCSLRAPDAEHLLDALP